jgi:hypothetical protein
MNQKQSEIDTVVNFQEARAKRTAEEMSADISAKGVRALAELQQLSGLKGKAGKIPDVEEQRALWAKNVRSILEEIRASGFSAVDLYNSSTENSFRNKYEDAQAYSKNLTAMQMVDSPKQVVGYNRYYEFIKLVSHLSGQSLQKLAARITEGVALVGDLAAIPEGCFQLAREMEIIANRVGRREGLVEKFQKLSTIRERHLCSGGSCVWPDYEGSFDDGIYTPRPGLKVLDAGGSGNAQCAVINDPDLQFQTIGSLMEDENDDPLIAQGKRDYRAMYIDDPALNRLAKNTYYENGGGEMRVSPDEDPLFTLPIHFGGIMAEPWLLDHIKGRYLIRHREELSGYLEHAFNFDPIEDFIGAKSDLYSQFSDGFYLAIFLYPNEDMNGLKPIVKLGADEFCFMAPLDALHISELAESVVLPKDVPYELPYQTESLLSYLHKVIESGELESSWRDTAYLLDQCPLWSL